jgi:hypothetical protein
MTEQVTQLYGASKSGITSEHMTTGLENSKEFVNFNFKVTYTDDDQNPV